jgi:hypothetical protein
MKEIIICFDDELVRKLTITAHDGCNLSLNGYIVHVLQEEMDDTERYFREEEGIDIFKK